MARKVKTKKQKIIDLLDQGKSVAEIVRITKSSPSYVYLVRTDYTAEQEQASGLMAISKRDEQRATPAGITTITAQSPMPKPQPIKKSLWQRIKEWLC